MKGTSQPRKVSGVLLEDVVFSPGPHKVDRERGIIYGVKLGGRESSNNHGLKGVKRTIYTPSAFEEALPMYGSAKVNVNHPARDRNGEILQADRPAEGRIGWVENARLEDGEPYGDLNLLLEHPMSARLFEAAERKPGLFAMSHHAFGDGEVRGDTYYVTKIPQIKSVDVVADGGTTKGFFESQNMSKGLQKVTKKQLLEMGYDVVSEDGGEVDEETYADQLCAAVQKIVEDEGLDKKDKLAKIRKILDIMDEGGEDEGEKKETPESEGGKEEKKDEPEKKEVKEGEDDKDDEKKEKKETDESKKDQKPAGKTELTESAIRDLCSLAGVDNPPRDLLETLKYLPTQTLVIKGIRTFKGSTQNGQRPRSAPQRGRQTFESRNGDDTPEGFRGKLLNR